MTDETRFFRNGENESRAESGEQTTDRCDDPKEDPFISVPGSRPVAPGGSIGKWLGKPILFALAIWLPVAILAIAGYFWVKVPLEKRLLASETRRLVGDINSLVKARSSIMAVSSDYLRKSGEISRESLDGIFEGLQNRFPDFRCLELINDKGEITAMVGELPISQAGLASRTQVGRFKSLGAAVSPDEEVLQDDPEAGLFFITRKHRVPGRDDQFVRAKFARGPLAFTLAATSNGSSRAARLIPISGGGVDDWQVAAGSSDKAEIRIMSDLWHGPIRAEALLTTKGWAVTLSRVGSSAILAYVFIALAGFGGMLVFLAVRISNRNPKHGIREWAEAVPQSEIRSAPAVRRVDTSSDCAADKTAAVFGIESEAPHSDSWGEDYLANDFFGPSESHHSETSDAFFGASPTPPFGDGLDEGVFGREGQPSHSKEPLQITWYEPFGHDGDKEPESDTSHEVSGDSGESFDRA